MCICRNGGVTFGHVAVARLTMRDFSEGFLDAYLDKAGAAVTATVGAYQLERTGIHLFEKIDGDHFTYQAVVESGGTWDFTVKAVTSGTLLVLSQQAFEQVVAQSEALQAHIAEV